jgi:hypothetical protein
MSEQSQDNLSYNFSSESSFSHQADKPYVKKELLYIIDNNGSVDYSRNEVSFETVSLSNNGRWADYRNAFVSIPMVAILTRSAGELTEPDAKKLLNFKASNVNFIDSMIVDYGNDNVIQQNSNISAYCTFKQHTEWSQDDVNINKHLGYRKDSNNWAYTEVGGIQNNASVPTDVFKHNDGGKELLLSNANLKSGGENHYERYNGLVHVYYYDLIINLKDTLFFSEMPTVRGGNFKITFRLNQSSSVITYGAGGLATRVVNNLKGSSNFLLRTAHEPPANGTTETISLKVVQNTQSNITRTHQKGQCRLYVPVNTMSDVAEKQYMSKGLQTVLYEDLYVQHVRAQSANFQVLLTNSLARMKRLVIVPMLSKYTNANNILVNTPQESCMSSEPATCSPCFIKDFNVQLSGSNVYQQNISYTYESFLNELNGKFGVNANMEADLCSSLLNMEDYNSNYGYIVVDLSRRYSHDENTPLSVQISGIIESAKELDLLCFITYSKSIAINLLTGQKVESK